MTGARVALVRNVSPKPRTQRLFRCLEPIAGIPVPAILRTLERLAAGVPSLGSLVAIGHDIEDVYSILPVGVNLAPQPPEQPHCL